MKTLAAEYEKLMTAAMLGSITVAVIYSFFVEHYVDGLTAGSVNN